MMKNIENKVRELTARYETADPVELCERLGIVVHYHELTDKINGFASSIDGVPFIVINSQLGYYEKKITIAHELGHLVLHGGTNSLSLSMNTSFCVTKYEREADCFAAHLLMENGREEFEAMDSVTAEDVSMITRMPADMIENAFFI